MYSSVNKLAVRSSSRGHTAARGSMRLDVNVQKVLVSCAGCVRAVCALVSKVKMESGRGSESNGGTAESETLLTARRSQRVSESGKARRKSRGAVEVWEKT